MAATLYGIKNCDTVKKAREWLDDQRIDYRFHDFRSDGLEGATVVRWLETRGVQTLVNKRSTTWKQLSDRQKESIVSEGAIELLLEHPTLIKRPLLDTGARLHCGFKDSDYAQIFS